MSIALDLLEAKRSELRRIQASHEHSAKAAHLQYMASADRAAEADAEATVVEREIAEMREGCRD